MGLVAGGAWGRLGLSCGRPVASEELGGGGGWKWRGGE